MMKKLRIFPALFLCFLLTFGVLPAFAAGQNPYDGFSAIDADEFRMASTASNTAEYIGGMWPGDWVCYRNMDFGSVSPYAVDLTVGVPDAYAGSMEMRLDSATGPVIANWKIIPSDWATLTLQNAQIVYPFTGTHDIYLLSTGGTGNIYTVQFHVLDTEKKFEYKEYDASPMFIDIAENPHRREIETVSKLGLVKFDTEDGSFLPELGISRAEFADGVYRVLGGEKAGLVSDKVFSDVSRNHKYAAAIAFLKEMGVVKGGSEGAFRPDEYITMAEASAMAIRAMDYGNVAEHTGGFESGYLSLASRVGLLKGISAREFISRGEFARLIYNMIHAEYLRSTGVVGEDLEYTTDRGILKQTLGIYSSRGVVMANYLTSLYSATPGLAVDEVVIHDVTYLVGETDATAMIGMKCDFYYTEENGMRTLVAIIPSNSTEVMEIADDGNGNILNVSSDGIEYLENNREQRIDFSNTTNFIYNGVVTGAGTDGTFSYHDFRGKIRLIDNGEGWETVIIEHPQNIIVSTVDSVNEKIVDRLTGESFDIDESNNVVLIHKEGKTVKFKKLTFDDVLLAYISRNANGKKFIRIDVTNESLTAAVTESGDDYVILDNGKSYKLAKEYSPTLRPGMYGVFRLNVKGEIISFRAGTEKGWEFGMFLDVDADTGLNSRVEVKIFNAASTVAVYPCADDAIIDGLKFDTAAEAVNGKNTYSGLRTIIPRSAVRYSLNEEGEIVKLDTALSGSGNINDTMRRLGGGASYCYDYENGLIFRSGEGMYSMSAVDSVIVALGTSDDEDYWKIGNPKSILKYPEWIYDNIEIYSSKGLAYEADFCVISGLVDYDTEGNSYMVFDRMSRAVSPKNEDVYKVYGYTNLGERTYYLRANDMTDSNEIGKVFKTVRKGDVLTVRTNNRNEIDRVTYLARYDLSSLPDGMTQPTLTANTMTSGGNLMEERFVFGRVIEKGDTGYLVVRYGDSEEARTEVLVSGAMPKVYKIAKNGGEAKLIKGLKVSNIAEGDIVFAAITKRKVVMYLVMPDMML